MDVCNHCELPNETLLPVIITGMTSYNGHVMKGGGPRQAVLCPTCRENLANLPVGGITIKDDDDEAAPSV